MQCAASQHNMLATATHRSSAWRSDAPQPLSPPRPLPSVRYRSRSRRAAFRRIACPGTAAAAVALRSLPCHSRDRERTAYSTHRAARRQARRRCRRRARQTPTRLMRLPAARRTSPSVGCPLLRPAARLPCRAACARARRLGLRRARAEPSRAHARAAGARRCVGGREHVGLREQARAEECEAARAQGARLGRRRRRRRRGRSNGPRGSRRRRRGGGDD